MKIRHLTCEKEDVRKKSKSLVLFIKFDHPAVLTHFLRFAESLLDSKPEMQQWHISSADSRAES